VWFISTAFIIAQLGTNISANTISAGCDLTALLPQYINIRRGGYVAAIVGFAILPWNLLKDSNRFTSYLSAYSVFLSSIAGVMVRTASISLSFSSRTRLTQTKRRTVSSRSQNTSSSEGATTAFRTCTTLAAAAGTITPSALTFGSSVYP